MKKIITSEWKAFIRLYMTLNLKSRGWVKIPINLGLVKRNLTI